MGGAERGAPEQAEAVPGAVAGLHADKALLDVLLRLPLVEAQHLHDEAGPGLAHEGDGAEGVDGREGEDEARDFDGAGQGRGAGGGAAGQRRRGAGARRARGRRHTDGFRGGVLAAAEGVWQIKGVHGLRDAEETKGGAAPL